MSITRNRELSQFGSFLYINDDTKNIGITEESSQYIGIGTTTPDAKLHIIGNTNVSGVISATGYYLNGDPLVNAEFSSWNTSNSNIYRLNGNVGIGSSVPESKLTVTGDAKFTGVVTATSFVGNISGNLTGGASLSQLVNSYSYIEVPDTNSFWITPGNNNYGLYWETTSGGLFGGTGDSNRLGFIGNGSSRFYVDLNNGNSAVSGTFQATQLVSTVSSPTSPFVVSSNALVANLNADLLRGKLLGGTATGDVVSIDATQTLLNKTLTSPTLTTPTIGSGGVNFSGSSSGTTNLNASATASGNLTLPAATDTLVARNTTDTLTNKTIAAGSNTISGLTNSNLSGTAGITNANLANSTISGVSLGSNLNSLTVGSYLSLNSGTTYNGSAARTISVNASSSNADPTSFPIVARDASGNFTAGTITATYFSGSGAYLTSIPNSATTASSANNPNTIVLRNSSGDFTAGTITATSFSGTSASFSGTVTAANFDTNSDMNLKTNIEPVKEAISIVEQINGVRFTWKQNSEKCVGVIAQEIEKILPELVSGDEIKSVNYNGLIGVLIEAVKELSNEISEIKNSLQK